MKGFDPKKELLSYGTVEDKVGKQRNKSDIGDRDTGMYCDARFLYAWRLFDEQRADLSGRFNRWH